MSRNHYHGMCVLWANLFPPVTDIPSSHPKHCQSGISGLSVPGSGKILYPGPPEGGGTSVPSTYTGGSWLPHSSAETWKWGAKRAASCSASLEAWDRETQRHSLAKLETLMLSGLPAVSYKRVISVQDVSRLRKPAPMAVSNSMAA